MGMIVSNNATLVTLSDFSNSNVLLGVLGLLLSFSFYAYKIRGAFILSIGITSIVAWSLSLNQTPHDFFSFPVSISPIFLKLDIMSALSLSLFPVIITFLITDMFDTLGTLTGVGTIRSIIRTLTSRSSL